MIMASETKAELEAMYNKIKDKKWKIEKESWINIFKPFYDLKNVLEPLI